VKCFSKSSDSKCACDIEASIGAAGSGIICADQYNMANSKQPDSCIFEFAILGMQLVLHGSKQISSCL
jgi:hypothetical protein